MISRSILRISCSRNISTFRKLTNKNVSSSSLLKDEKWDLYAGVLVERLPIVSKSLKPIEQEFQSVLWQLEYEGSLKSDHEMKHERDLLQAERIRKGEVEVDLDDSASKQTAQDLKDAYVEEFKKFSLASTNTEADEKNNIKSPNQKLESTLYLIVEQKYGSKSFFALPNGIRKDGETMRDTAERVLKEKCGENIHVTFYGNAPCGFYKYKYPTEQRKGSVGAKVFFYRTSLNNGNVDPKIEKFEWHDKDSLINKLQGSYAESVEKFLL